MIPTEAQLAAVAAIRCRPLDGDEHPLAWIEADELAPVAPPEGAVRRLSVPQPVHGPSGQWTVEIPSDGRTGPRGVAPGQPEIGRSGLRRFAGYLTGRPTTPAPPPRPPAAPRSASQPVGVEPELRGSGAQAGAQERDGANPVPNTPAGDPR